MSTYQIMTALVYAAWPSKREAFEKAARIPLQED
jgi:cbb3-type cytochrome oxidase subunit 3